MAFNSWTHTLNFTRRCLTVNDTKVGRAGSVGSGRPRRIPHKAGYYRRESEYHESQSQGESARETDEAYWMQRRPQEDQRREEDYRRQQEELRRQEEDRRR